MEIPHHNGGKSASAHVSVCEKSREKLEFDSTDPVIGNSRHGWISIPNCLPKEQRGL